MDRIDVGLDCGDIECRKGRPLKPLLRLCRPYNVTKHQIYVIQPYLSFVKPRHYNLFGEMFVGDCDDLDPEATCLCTEDEDRLSCNCGMVHYIISLVTPYGMTEDGSAQFHVIQGL